MAAWQDAGKLLAMSEHGAAVVVVGDGDRSVDAASRRFPSRKSTMTDKAPEGASESEADKGKGVMADSAMGEAFQCYPYVVSLMPFPRRRGGQRLIQPFPNPASSSASYPTLISTLSMHWPARAASSTMA